MVAMEKCCDSELLRKRSEIAVNNWDGFDDIRIGTSLVMGSIKVEAGREVRSIVGLAKHVKSS